MTDTPVTVRTSDAFGRGVCVSGADETRRPANHWGMRLLSRNRVARMVKTRIHPPVGGISGERLSHKSPRVSGCDPCLCLALNSAVTGRLPAGILGASGSRLPELRAPDDPRVTIRGWMVDQTQHAETLSHATIPPDSYAYRIQV